MYFYSKKQFHKIYRFCGIAQNKKQEGKKMLRTFKKYVALFLVAVMMVAIMPTLTVTANSSNVLANIGIGQIFEFRNSSDRSVQLMFDGINNTYIDFSRYERDGGMLTHDRGRGARTTSRGLFVPASGMVVIEHRAGSAFNVLGDASNIQVAQLQSPALYVQEMSVGVRETFTNNSAGRRSLGWVTSGYPVYSTGATLWNWLTRYTVRVDGTTTAPVNLGAGDSFIMVEPGETMVLRGNECGRTPNWQRDASGSFTAFSGQPYRLTIDGNRSYPPGSTSVIPPMQTPPTTPPQNSNRYFIGDVFAVYFYFDNPPLNISNVTNDWRTSIFTISPGTTLFAYLYTCPFADTRERFYGWDLWLIDNNNYEIAVDGIPTSDWLLLGGNTNMEWVELTPNSGYVVFDTPGRFAVCGAKDGRFRVVVAGEATTPPTGPPTQPPQIPSGTPEFTNPPSSTDNGVWMEFNTVPNNRFGYRIFRATTATGDGISITDFPIMVNPAHSLNRIITFDPNVRPNRDYWFYVREVLEEARFDASTTTLIPEVLGEASARIHVRTSADITEPTAERGFIMMFIGNPYMNVNNVWEGIDPPENRTAPVINAGRTMVPIRAIIEAKGGSAGWNASDRRIDLRSHGNHVQMWLGQRNVQVNNSPNEMDVMPEIVNGRTLIPLRFVAEFLGSQIEWIGSERMIVIVYELQ